MTEYDWPMVETPDGRSLPWARFKIPCPYPSCKWTSMGSVTTTHEPVTLPRHYSQCLMAHINEEHAYIYDRLGLEQDNPGGVSSGIENP